MYYTNIADYEKLIALKENTKEIIKSSGNPNVHSLLMREIKYPHRLKRAILNITQQNNRT